MISDAIRRWLLTDADPAVRVRFVEEFGAGAERDELAAARSELGRSGWGPAILGLQLPDGQWDAPGTTARELYRPKYIATNWRLLVLADLGFTREEPRIDRAARLMIDRYRGPTGELGGSESEVCFTGNCVRMFTRFGYGDEPVVREALEWLVRTQKADGGWNCFPVDSGTLDGWEAMAAFAALAPGHRTAAIDRAIERGANFYLDRGLLREGAERYVPWERIHYPTHYYYDYLVGLEMLTALGYGDDPRLRPVLERLEAARNPDGRWDLEAVHPDLPPGTAGWPPGETYEVPTPYYPFVLEPAGRPSRWNTLRAMTVLRRAGRL